MSEPKIVSPADAYARVAAALVADSGIEAVLIEDFGGTLKSRLGITVPGTATLARSNEGFRLDWNGRSYDLSDPRGAGAKELNDAELELVSGGVGQMWSCGKDDDTKPDPNSLVSLLKKS